MRDPASMRGGTRNPGEPRGGGSTAARGATPRRARALAAGALAALVGLAAGAARAEELSESQQLARSLLQELLETDTSQDAGRTTPAAELAAKRLRDAGFDA